jgi:hypothetical protein
MGGRWWLGILAFLPLWLAAAATAEAPVAGTQGSTAEREAPTAVSIVSGDTVTFRTTSDLEGTLRGDATTATGTVLLAGGCPEGNALSVIAVPGTVSESSPARLTETPEAVESTCRVKLEWPRVAFTEPATGHLVVAVAGLDDATVPYQVTRTTNFIVFTSILLISIAVGSLGVVILWSWVKDAKIPVKWEFKNHWAASLTGLSAVAAGLLALGGVLTEYAPQYSTAGVLAANLVVLVLVGAAPMVFAAFAKAQSSQDSRRRGFVAAGALSLAAAAGQACLVALVIVSGSTDGWARIATFVILGGVIYLMLYYARHQASSVEKDDAAS